MYANRVKEAVRKFILAEFMPAGEQLQDDAPLFEGGIIDSIGMIKLTAFLEEEFGVRVSPGDVTMDRFDTVNNVAAFVVEKRGAAR